MRLFSISIGLFSGLLFGIATPISKYSLSFLSSFLLAGLLYLGSALAFLPHVAIHGKKEMKNLVASGSVRHVLGIVASGGILGPLFLMLGLRAANSMSVSVWLNLELVATAFFGALFFREHLGKTQLAGIAFTLAAGVLASCGEGASGLVSLCFIAAACACWGVDNQLTSLVDGITPQTTTFIKGAVGGTVNLSIGAALASLEDQHPALAAIPLEPVLLALGVGVVSYGVSIFLYVTAAQNLGATRAQILFSTAPFWGMLAAAVFLRERPTPLTAVSAILLAGGIALSALSGHAHRHRHSALTHVHLHRHDDGHHTHSHDGLPPSTRHSHEHTHEEIEHDHPHYPDLHHRHGR